MTEGRAAAGPVLRQAVPAFRDHEITLDESIRWGICAAAAAVTLWDFDAWDAVFTRRVELARGAGALDVLPIALNAKGLAVAFCGDLARAEALADEANAVLDMTGASSAPFTALSLAALRGDEAVASAVIDGAIREGVTARAGFGVQFARWTGAILYNGLGRYDDALSQAQQASEETPAVLISVWALPELVEAAARTHASGAAASALERLTDATADIDADWGAGILARSRALLVEGTLQSAGAARPSSGSAGRGYARNSRARISFMASG
jgi:tetratricopeptide (TPR) repeat protein